MKPKLKPHYSGNLSKLFWKQIWAVRNKRLRDELYILGCNLQNIESVILRRFESISKRRTK